ncbi:hypothetical protein CPS_3857 [Colwellia psychrerythraea 34H]|uniref:Uncharacterized protein n=1 Tax=Colwellia psychrerythraea (strain 34H / ATCC BAA-681) TaxID=167879 RepID=Q47XF1_COLP3|nr:hypothetical protein CPS_3857 [Colwellia psychrerythraea 34H]
MVIEALSTFALSFPSFAHCYLPSIPLITPLTPSKLVPLAI